MHLQLHYFDFPFWRAETSRLALHLGGIPFDDVRVDRAHFMELKASGELPYGQLPVLDIDGVRLAQSGAISRFCGKLSGLYPEDALEAAQVDELLDLASQMTESISPTVREKDPEKRQAMRRELGATKLPTWLAALEKRVDSGDGSPYLVGDQLSVADLAIWRLLGWLTGGILDGIPTHLLAPCPTLQSHQSMLNTHTEIAAWMAAHYPSWAKTP